LLLGCAGIAQAGDLDPTSANLPRVRLDLPAFAAELRGAPLAGSLPAVGLSSRVQPESRGFYQGYFLPRMTTQFDRLSPYRVVPSSGQALSEFMLLDQVTGAAQQRAENGITKAVRNYLLETTAIGRWVDSFGTESTRSPLGAPRAGRAFRTGFGIAHGLPRVDMRYGVGHTLLRLGVGADSTVGLEMRRNAPATAASFSARYDWGEQAYTLGCRVAF